MKKKPRNLTTCQKSIAKNVSEHTTDGNWKDYKWQLVHSIRDLATFEKLTEIEFNEEERKKLEKTIRKFPVSITPYYASLIEKENYRNDPIFKQAFPNPAELRISKCEMSDPLHEDKDSPVEGITHRYPDRVLFLVSNRCSMYCRHCTRKRKVGDPNHIPSKKQILKGIQYIKNNRQVRDVLLSGGDPFMLPDDYLDWILTELRKIPHVEIIRIGSRMPVVLPYRITDQLVEMLKKHYPIWLNTHFNHPRELTHSAREALRKLADAGIPLGNQSVLLAGVNDCPRIMKKLNQKLVQNRVRPYYLFQCDLSEGLSHFRTPIGKGIEIIESLVGHTSGFAVPTYVVDAPGGGGKIPIMPNYIISWSTNKVVLRNYEGVITTYKEPDSYEPIFCDRNCDECALQLKLDEADETKAIGIEKLLTDANDEISLVPNGNTVRTKSKKQLICQVSPMSGSKDGLNFKIRNVKVEDVKEVYKLLVANRPYVGLNSRYTYFLLAQDFSDTCVVVEHDDKIIAFSSGYIPPSRTDTLFNWETVVHRDYRGYGLQKRMLLHQIKMANAKFFEGTVNPSNEVSRRNFCELAEVLHTKCEKKVLFKEEDFENDGHEAEVLYRIGPISQNELKQLA